MSDYVVGIDLGGSKSALALVAPDNTIVKRARLETGNVSPEDLLVSYATVISDFKHHLSSKDEIKAIGLCAPGPLDHDKGIIINPVNLPKFLNTPFQAMLENYFGIPASIEHDAKAAALGEYHFGEGQGFESLIYIVIGTGVGAAIIIDGQLYRGVKNFAGEFGHTTLDRYGERCHCGSRGCFETYMSGPSLTRRYETLTAETIEGAKVAERAQTGEEAATKVMTDAGEALGIAVASMAMHFDIERYIVGGSVAKAGDVLLEPARAIIPSYSFKTVAPRVSLVKTKLEEDAALLGCAHLARQTLKA